MNFIQLMEQGVAALQAQNFALAESRFRDALGAKSNNPDALHLLGLAQHYQGDSEAAIRSIRKALKRARTNPTYLNNLGQIQKQAGYPDEAIKTYMAAARAAPDNFEIKNNLGNALSDRGRYRDAEKQLLDALKLNPGYLPARFNLGTLYLETEEFAKAAEHSRAVIAADPGYRDAYNTLGLALFQLGESDDALAQFERALQIDPGYVDALMNKAQVFDTQGRTEQALALISKTLQLAPGRPDLLERSATLHRFLGRFDDAAEICKQLSAHPGWRGKALFLLASMNRLGTGDADIAEINRLLDDKALADDQRADILFSLHIALDKAARFDEAFDCLKKANALTRKSIRFNMRDIEKHHEYLRTIFDESMSANTPKAPSGGPTPIFIVGMPRSGSTLVDQILASHRSVQGAGESDALPDIVHALGLAPGDIGTDAEARERQASLKNLQAENLRGRYFASLGLASAPTPFTLDKQLMNYRNIGLINLLFPDARIIHMIRNPMATCFSCYTQRFTENVGFAFELEETARFLIAQQDLMAYWRSWSRVPVLEVVYEDVVNELESETRRILDFCGLDWDEDCLRFHENTRTVKTASLFQVRQPLFSSKLDHWKNYAAQLEPLARILEDRQV